MQAENEKIIKFKNAVGNVIKSIRINDMNLSLNKFANQFDFDKGNLSKTEHGKYNIFLMTAWKISEAAKIKFSDFAKLLEAELGEDFSFIDNSKVFS